MCRGGSGLITYYKSRNLSSDPSRPMVYVEEEGRWKSYASSGVVEAHRGPLPDYVRLNADEAPFHEVIDLIRSYEAEGTRAKEEMSRRQSSTYGVGGWAILPVIGLVLTALLSLYFLFGQVLPLLRSWVTLTASGTTAHQPLMGPYLVFMTFVEASLLVFPIFLLVLVAKKKRVLVPIIVSFYAVALLFMVIEFVALATFIDRIVVDRGFPDEAVSLVWQGMVQVVFRGILICAIWIPYFLCSDRVRNTFTEPWGAARATSPEFAARSAALAALAAEAREETVAALPVPAEPRIGETPPADPRRRKPKMLLIPIIAGLVVAVGVVVGVGAWRLANPPTTANAVTVHMDAYGDQVKHYSNSNENFSFDYPADWGLQAGAAPTSGDGAFDMLVYDQSGHKISGLSYDGVEVTSFKLQITPTAAQISDIRTKTESSLTAAAGEGATLEKASSDVTINGLLGFTMTLSQPAPDGETVVLQLYALFNGAHMYYVSLQSVGKPSSDLQQRQEAVLNSFAVGY